MTEEQKAAIARAEAKIAAGLELYNERNRLAFLYHRLAIDDLRRVNAVIAKLGPDQIRRVLAFAEGLAQWSSPEPESKGAEISPGESPTKAATP